MNYLLLKCELVAMTYKPQSNLGKPDSAMIQNDPVMELFVAGYTVEVE